MISGSSSALCSHLGSNLGGDIDYQLLLVSAGIVLQLCHDGFHLIY
jgi:hypothetical protein